MLYYPGELFAAAGRAELFERLHTRNCDTLDGKEEEETRFMADITRDAMNRLSRDETACAWITEKICKALELHPSGRMDFKEKLCTAY